jgi:hypothetical protein
MIASPGIIEPRLSVRRKRPVSPRPARRATGVPTHPAADRQTASAMRINPDGRKNLRNTAE